MFCIGQWILLTKTWDERDIRRLRLFYFRYDRSTEKYTKMKVVGFCFAVLYSALSIIILDPLHSIIFRFFRVCRGAAVLTGDERSLHWDVVSLRRVRGSVEQVYFLLLSSTLSAFVHLCINGLIIGPHGRVSSSLSSLVAPGWQSTVGELPSFALQNMMRKCWWLEGESRNDGWYRHPVHWH